jgi:hypothetical protein
LDWGRGENGKTEKWAPLSSDLLLLYYYGFLRVFNIEVKKWSLDRRPQDPSIHRRWHPAFCLEIGALRPLWVIFAEEAKSQWGWAVSILGIPCGSAPALHNGSKLWM